MRRPTVLELEATLIAALTLVALAQAILSLVRALDN